MAAQHWSKMQERGNQFGMRILLISYRLFGRRGLWVILFPVVLYLFLTGKTARVASLNFLAQVNQFNGKAYRSSWQESFRHFRSFADSAFDKIDAWLGRIKQNDIHYTNEALYEQLDKQKQGAIFIGSHLGNLEVCRALSQHRSCKVINVLVFTHHAVEFNKILKRINPTVDVNLIQVTDIGPDIAILLKEKVEQGEVVVIVGDRTSSTRAGRVIECDFLGKPAPFSQGPFILAALLDCPVFFLFCLKDKDQQGQTLYRVIFEKYADKLTLPRKTRQIALQQIMTDYAARLTHFAALYPYQWFNFYDFWQNDHSVIRDQIKEK